MALSLRVEPGIRRIARIVLNSAGPEALAAFYVGVLGFERIATASPDRIVLHLGGVRLDLRRVDVPADAQVPAYPGWSPRFQHCAIVVSDMARAMASLERSTTWTPITRGGPQRLPANTGGVTAFKFRDPAGHPLELLLLPDEPATNELFVRIDHSAISVADVDRSVAFYERMGLTVAGRTLNRGVEQSRLDDIDGAVVDVVSLRLPSGEAPHLELLAYRGDHDRRDEAALTVDDVAATRLVFEAVDPTRPPTIVDTDPDGHFFEVEA